MSRFRFVSPCCRKPIDINTLDDVKAVPQDDGTFLWNTRCCQDYMGAEPSDQDVQHEWIAVYRASVKAADDALEAEIKLLRSNHQADANQFAEHHDPTVDRIIVCAVFGSNGNSLVANHNVGEYEDREAADKGLKGRAAGLIQTGWIETRAEPAPGILRQRSFRKGDDTRHVAYWSQPINNGDGPACDHATATGMYDRY